MMVAHRLDRLEAALLTCSSATRLLERWTGRTIIARRMPGADKPLPAAGRDALRLGPGETTSYRRVALTAGEAVLCLADNWYIPARLDAAMNLALVATDQPFGHVVAALGVFRQVLSHGPAEQDGATVLRLRALVMRQAGPALCLVDETYLGTLLACCPAEETP